MDTSRLVSRFHRISERLPILLVVMLHGFAAQAAPRDIEVQQTVVVANRSVPESVELARYYMSVRGIPTNRLCELDLPAGETISRWYYENKVREPLQGFLRDQKMIEQVRREETSLGVHDNPWRTIQNDLRYVVCMYGMPLRIAESRPYLISKLDRLADEPFQRDGAALDSELTCMLWESYAIMGYQPNPMYNLVHWSRNNQLSRPLLIAARLDGPDPETVRRMIDDTLKAEKEGLHGRVYVDMRSIQDPDYFLGDYWLREAGERLRRTGYETQYDLAEDLFSEYFPMDHAAFYLGWYAEHVQGPFTRPGFQFQPGAIAYHLHSSSAKSLRTKTKFWAGPLLAAGAAAVMGAVDEPYLAYTPDLQIFIDRLCAGFTLGESAYFSQRALSWQITVVGDPLYRPFSTPLDEEIKLLELDKNPAIEWLHLRRMNLLIDQQQFNVAMQYGRMVLKQGNSLVIREKMADLYAKNELWNDAISEYEKVIYDVQIEDQAMRVGHRLILLLRLMKKEEAAQKIKDNLVKRWPDSRMLPYLDRAVP